MVFTQGDQSGYSLTGEFVDIDHFKLTSTVADVGTSSYTVQISGANAQWNGLWNQLELVFEPTATEGTYNWRLDLNGAPAGQNGVISNIQLEPTRLTLGNGWLNGHATGEALSMPMQDFRMWNSQRETYASETPAFQITGNEIGLQLWLPMDELEGTPADRARMRDVIMEANWYSPGASHALDFASNTNGSLIPSISGVNWTPDGTRNTTLEFWVKPGGLNEGIMSINGTADPDIDLRRVGWSGFIDELGRLGFANGTDTMRTQQPLSDAWHHVALVRRYNGTALLYIDGEEVAVTLPTITANSSRSCCTSVRATSCPLASVSAMTCRASASTPMATPTCTKPVRSVGRCSTGCPPSSSGMAPLRRMTWTTPTPSTPQSRIASTHV